MEKVILMVFMIWKKVKVSILEMDIIKGISYCYNSLYASTWKKDQLIGSTLLETTDLQELHDDWQLTHDFIHHAGIDQWLNSKWLCI